VRRKAVIRVNEISKCRLTSTTSALTYAPVSSPDSGSLSVAKKVGTWKSGSSSSGVVLGLRNNSTSAQPP